MLITRHTPFERCIRITEWRVDCHSEKCRRRQGAGCRCMKEKMIKNLCRLWYQRREELQKDLNEKCDDAWRWEISWWCFHSFQFIFLILLIFLFNFNECNYSFLISRIVRLFLSNWCWNVPQLLDAIRCKLCKKQHYCSCLESMQSFPCTPSLITSINYEP